MMGDMAAHVVFQKPLNRKALATSLAWEVQLGILDGKDIISNLRIVLLVATWSEFCLFTWSKNLPLVAKRAPQVGQPTLDEIVQDSFCLKVFGLTSFS